jgi:hypothetical protein
LVKSLALLLERLTHRVRDFGSSLADCQSEDPPVHGLTT